MGEIKFKKKTLVEAINTTLQETEHIRGQVKTHSGSENTFGVRSITKNMLGLQQVTRLILRV